MENYLVALAIALMPALGNFAGGLVAELGRVSPRTLSRALHAAAGIVIAVVGVELMARAITIASPWIAVLAFVLGGMAAVGIDKMIDLVQHRFGGGEGNAGPWMIYAGVSIDLFSDGLMIGTGATLSLGLGLLLGLGQVPADFPEGFATLATLRDRVASRMRRLLIAASFVLPIFLGTTVGYFTMRGQPEWIQLSLLAFTGGILLSISVEEMVTQAHEATAGGERDPWEGLILVAGFGLFALLSAYLGE
jgi:ZIP family zinc transporter